VKRIRKSRAARVLSWLLTVVMTAPIFRSMLAPTPAQAQAVPTPTSVQTVIVLDFLNKSDFMGDTLAAYARDAVRVELANSTRFEPLTRDEVTAKARELGLHPPYDQVAISKLARELGAQAVVTGEISFVRVDAKQTPKTVRVGLKVRVQEATTGDLLNGAAQIGEARARPGVSDNEALAMEAVSNAAVLSVRQILAYNLPVATVLSLVGSAGAPLIALINRGSRDGVVPGMEMIVLRRGQVVGKIRVTTVFPTDAEAEVIDNTLGVNIEDKARAIFPMPDFSPDYSTTRAPKKSTSTNTLSTLGKVLVVALIGVLIATASRGGNQAISGVVAEAATFNGSAAVRLQWKDNIFGSGAQREYHIWRADHPFNFADTPVAATTQRTYTDRPAPFSFWNGTNQFLQPPAPTAGGGGGDATTVTPTAGAVLGFTTGQTTTYQVTGVLRRRQLVPPTGGGGQQQVQFEDIESDPVPSGPVTPIDPVVLVAPSEGNQNINIRDITFRWQSRTGATEFQVEISTVPNFTDRTRIAILPIVLSTAPFADNVEQNTSLPSPDFLLTNTALRRDPVFRTYADAILSGQGTSGVTIPTLYWRVGARNAGDRPGPVHAFSNNHRDSDRTFRFIYSNIPNSGLTPVQGRSFKPAPTPPGTP
jgi:hypothetical protein